MDELCGQLLAHLQPACKQEMVCAVTTLKESVLRHAQTQEDHLYKQVMDRLQPTINALTKLVEVIEAQKMRAVDASPLAVAQVIT